MIMNKGYAGQGLSVDLTTRTIAARDLERQFAEKYLGGNGFGARLLSDHVGPEVDALSPENMLIFATGPSVWHHGSHGLEIRGDRQVAAHRDLWRFERRWLLWARAQVRRVGLSSSLPDGRNHPVFLNIHDDQVELRDARDLWGLTTSETRGGHPPELGDEKIKTATIGPAGENLVRFAGIQVTSQRSAARCGLGAVMGSKNLKAIAARGHSQVPLADPERFKELADQFRRRLRANAVFAPVHEHGTPGITAMMDALGRFPTKNFQMGSFDEIGKIDADALADRAFVRHMGCYACPVACDALYRVPDGPYAGHRPTQRGIRDAELSGSGYSQFGSGQHPVHEQAVRRPGAGYHLGRSLHLIRHGTVGAGYPDRRRIRAGCPWSGVTSEISVKFSKMMAYRAGLWGSSGRRCAAGGPGPSAGERKSMPCTSRAWRFRPRMAARSARWAWPRRRRTGGRIT